jgi:uncharacterized membrane protein HdeD (DUF308 family)
MTLNPARAESIARAIASAVHEHWMMFLTEGIILVVLGIAAIVLPPIATIAFTIIIGWIFLISGVLGLITTFWARHAPGFWWALTSAIIAIAAGVVLLLWPISGAVSLTLLLIAFFVVEGIAWILYAMEHRNELGGRWGWMLTSGIIDLILAAIVFSGLPGTALGARSFGRDRYGVRRRDADRNGFGSPAFSGRLGSDFAARFVVERVDTIVVAARWRWEPSAMLTLCTRIFRSRGPVMGYWSLSDGQSRGCP